MNTISAQHVKMIYCYLVDHSQYKQIEDNKLTLLPIFCGVPHASTLNAMLFNLYFAVNLQYVRHQHQYCTVMTQQDMNTLKLENLILVLARLNLM